MSLALTLIVGANAPPALTFGWLVAVQALAGIIEGTLTAMAVRKLVGRAPGLLVRQRSEPSLARPELRRGWLWAALALVLVVAAIPLASSRPDALENVISRLRAEP